MQTSVTTVQKSVQKCCIVHVSYTLYRYSPLHGAKKLCIPRTSTLFKWDAKEVVSVCVRDTLYIASEQCSLSMAQPRIDTFVSLIDYCDCDKLIYIYCYINIAKVR